MPQIKNFDEVREFIKSTSEKIAIYVGCDSRQVNDNTASSVADYIPGKY